MIFLRAVSQATLPSCTAQPKPVELNAGDHAGHYHGVKTPMRHFGMRLVQLLYYCSASHRLEQCLRGVGVSGIAAERYRIWAAKRVPSHFPLSEA
jgi:hypothetical protein